MGRIIREQQNENGQDGYIQTNHKDTEAHFVERVTSIPLIKDSVSTARTITTKTSLGRFALSTLQYAIDHPPQYITRYYEYYVQPQVQKADAFGCRSLDIIQEKYPIVNQPVPDLIDGVKQTVTYPAHVAVQRLTHVVDHLENTVDQYLPAQEEKDKQKEEKNQVKRVYHVVRRVTNAVVPTSREDLKQLAAESALLQDIAGKLNFAQETLVKSVSVYSTAAQERLPPAVLARIQQATVLVFQVTDAIQQQMSQVALSSERLKQHLQDTIHAIQEQLSHIKAELARTDISYTVKIKHITHHLQHQVAPLVEKATIQLK